MRFTSLPLTTMSNLSLNVDTAITASVANSRSCLEIDTEIAYVSLVILFLMILINDSSVVFPLPFLPI